MTFSRYSEYQDTHDPFTREIPSHWRYSRIKNVCLLKMGQSPSSSDCNEDGVGLPFLQGNADFGVSNPAPKSYCPVATKFADPGDILFSVRAPVGELNIADQPYGIGRGLCALTVKFADQRFIRHALEVVREHLFSVATGSTYEAVTTDQVACAPIAIPEPDEQTRIADFLDLEIDKIDELVSVQEKLIALLKEKRQAVISHAVTKGLDPCVPMKGSGIEWLGEVPAHWEVRKLSSITTKITNGYVGPTRDILVDEGVRYLQSLHIKENKIRFDVPYYVREEWSLEHKKSILEAGDVLIVQTGDIGQVAVVTEEFSGCNCHALIVCSPVRKSLSGEWLSWVLNTAYGRQSLLSIQTGALHPHLNCGNVKDLYIPVPPLADQKNICKSVEERLRQFGALIEESESAGLLLRERRSALVAAAVTGKIDVRNFRKEAA